MLALGKVFIDNGRMGEQLEQEVLDNPYRQLLGEIALAWSEQVPLAKERRQIEAEQEARISEVYAEFRPHLQTRDDMLAQNEVKRSPQAIREQLAALYEADSTIGQAVLDIAVQKWWDGSVASLAAAIATEPDRFKNNRSRVETFAEQYEALTALQDQLSKLPGGATVPVLLLNLASIEEINEQAQWEGRDSSTGVYFTELSAIYGLAGRDSLRVRATPVFRDDAVAPVDRVDAVDLHLTQNAEHGQFNDSIVKSEPSKPDESTQQTARISLFGTTFNHWSDDSLNQGPLISWQDGHRQNFRVEQAYTTPRRYLYLQVGQRAVGLTVEHIRAIANLSASSKEFLRTVPMSATQSLQ